VPEKYFSAVKELVAFRGQLAMPEHRQLFDYWYSLMYNGQLPCRKNFSPAQVPRLLPAVFLVDVAQPLSQSRVRLAGTKLREIYDRDMTGSLVVEMDANDRAEFWLDTYRKAVDTQRPASGIVNHVTRSARTLHQHWLKLPLRNGASAVEIVLCLDVFVETAELTARKKIAIT
jgi:hypothetical protein